MDVEKAIKNLEGRGFAVKHFATKQQAAAWLDSELDGKEIGIGGSVSADELGLYELLNSHNTVHWHWKDKAPEVSLLANRSPVFITGVNALAGTGEIVNIDGRGNRITGALFNKEAVYYLAGINKLCATLDDAIFRAKNVAAPLNAKRLKKNTPCAVDGKCHDCRSKDRICRGMTIHMCPMMGTGSTTVVLVDEELGM